jgi:ABC-type ATPase with predicted acetyltransferase domain
MTRRSPRPGSSAHPAGEKSPDLATAPKRCATCGQLLEDSARPRCVGCGVELRAGEYFELKGECRCVRCVLKSVPARRQP